MSGRRVVDIMDTAAARLPSSPILQLMEVAKQRAASGADVINLSGGEPDMPPPPVARACLAELAEAAGPARYAPVAGLPELRRALAERCRSFGLPTNDDEILITNGAKHAISTALMTGLASGDEVIVPAPYWVSYLPLITLCGARPIVVPTQASDDWKLTPTALAAALTPRSRWLILNTPNNPTGAVYSSEELEALMDVVDGHERLMVLSDEVYSDVVYAGRRHVSPAALPRGNSRVVVCHSMSKSFAMAGWRVGYLYASRRFVEMATSVQSHWTSGVCTVAQRAAIAALTHADTFPDSLRAVFEDRRSAFLQALGQVPDIQAYPPEGGLCLWIDVRRLLDRTVPGLGVVADDVTLARMLLTEAGVAAVPGTAFGVPGHLRVALAESTERLRTAAGRIADFAGRASPREGGT